MKSCLKIQKHLSLYVGHELDSSQRDLVDQHLKHCSKCKQQVEQYLCMKKLTNKLSDKSLPNKDDQDIFESVWQQINHSQNRSSKFKIVIRPVFAIAIVAIIASIFFLKPPLKPSKSLSTYLIQKDYKGLYEALQKESQRNHLMKEEISIILLIRSLDNMQNRYRNTAIISFVKIINMDPKFFSQSVNISQLDLKALKQKKIPPKVTLNQLLQWIYQSQSPRGKTS